MKIFITSCLLLLSFALVANEAKESKVASETSSYAVSDGPYIDVNENHLEIHWICDNQVKRLVVSNSDIPYQFSQCGLEATVDNLNFVKKDVIYSGDFPVAVVSDIHGQHDLFIKLLENNGIIDEQHRWNYGKGRFVITGDIFDRGPKVLETLWFLYDLEQQALKAGGELIYIIGNHEEMVLNGDLRYLHPKYNQVEALFGINYSQLFSKKSLLGRWLRSKPVVVKINDTVLLHGGLHPDLAKDKVSLEIINQNFHQAMDKRYRKHPLTEEDKLWLKRNGPIWYRGYFLDVADGFEKDLDQLLDYYQLQQIAVGHTSTKKIESHFNGKVFAVDASMKLGHYGELLFIEDSGIYAATLDGKRIKLKNRNTGGFTLDNDSKSH